MVAPSHYPYIPISFYVLESMANELIWNCKCPLFSIFGLLANYGTFSIKRASFTFLKCSMWPSASKSKSSSMQQNGAFAVRYELFLEGAIHIWDKSDHCVTRWSDQKVRNSKSIIGSSELTTWWTNGHLCPGEPPYCHLLRPDIVNSDKGIVCLKTT